VTCPVPHELLVRYWAGDVTNDELDAIEEHVLGCAVCCEASAQVAAIARTLAEVIPPIAVGRDLARAEARGVRQVTNDFQPGVPREAWLHPDTDLLVHRLLGDLGDVASVSLEVRQPNGEPMVSFDDVPFDPAEGAVLVACQRHFVESFGRVSLDVDVVVRCKLRRGGEREDTYTVHHRIG